MVWEAGFEIVLVSSRNYGTGFIHIRHPSAQTRVGTVLFPAGGNQQRVGKDRMQGECHVRQQEISGSGERNRCET